MQITATGATMVAFLWLLLVPVALIGRAQAPLDRALWGAMTAIAALSGAALWVVFQLADLSVERDDELLWPWVVLTSLALGAFSVRRGHAIRTREIILTLLTVLAGCATMLALTDDLAGLADARPRAVLISLVLGVLSAYFGASVAYISWESDGGFGFESMIGRRFLLSKSSKALSTVTLISVVGVTLGVWLVIVCLAILGGFGSELERKIIGANATIVVERDRGRPFPLYQKEDKPPAQAGLKVHRQAPLLKQIRQIEGITEATPFVQGEAAVASGSNFSSAVLFGIDPQVSPTVLRVLAPPLAEGDLCPLMREAKLLRPTGAAAANDDAAAPTPDGIVIEEKIASLLGLQIGSQVRTTLTADNRAIVLQVVAVVDDSPDRGGLRHALVGVRWGGLFAPQENGGGLTQAWREFHATLTADPPIASAYVHLSSVREEGRHRHRPQADPDLATADALAMEVDEGYAATLVAEQGTAVLPIRLVAVDPTSRFGSMHRLRHHLRRGQLCTMQWAGERPRSAERPASLFAPPAPLPNIVIGVELQKILNVRAGDKVRVISPTHERMTPVGMVPSSQGFRVAGVFNSEMYEIDARFAYITLAAGQRFFELGGDRVSGVQLSTETPDVADQLAVEVRATLGASYQALDWKARNQTLFAALKLERVVTFVVLVFIILVASFSIVNTLTMSIIEKRKEIAILKTMGARDGSVMKIFLLQGMLVGTFGTVVGASLALVTVMALEYFKFWIPADIYYIKSLPVKLSYRDIVSVCVAALIIVWDFAVFPALRGAKLDPVEGLRGA